MKLTPELALEYRELFTSARITNPGAVKWALDKIQRNWSRYEDVSQDTGVPAFVIACIHCLESSFSFGAHLHNGDPLSARTRQVPAGRPKTGTPPFTWEESAVDALAYDGLTTVREWNLATALHALEGFNGWGYRTGRGQGTTPPRRSPYLWSMTQHYTHGKYVEDGVFDPYAVSQQVGCAALILGMEERGLPLFKTITDPDEPVPGDEDEEPVSKGRLYAPCPVPLPWLDTFSRGSFGLHIYQLQCALIGLGYLPKPANGELVGDDFNERVYHAVTRLQESMGLVTDGIVGPQTRVALEKALLRARAPKPDPVNPDPVKPDEPTKGGVATLRSWGGMHTGKWSGLKRLKLTIGGEDFAVCSGQARAQTFRRPQDPRSTPGNAEPVPQGRYRIGDIEWAGGKDNYAKHHPAPGLGPVWIPLTAEFSDDRGAFGIHGDYGAQGTMGCVGLFNERDLRRLVAALRKHDPKVLSVEWGLS